MRRFELGPGPSTDDYVVDCNGSKLVIDNVSLEFVKGATVDFTDELIKSAFEVGSWDLFPSAWLALSAPEGDFVQSLFASQPSVLIAYVVVSVQVVNNPNAGSKCGCGSSFTPKDM